jgi:tryptophan-rich sensory protein
VYGLRKPGWAPPAGLFGPVWTVLYAMIGGVGWRVWTRQPGSAIEALHVAQLLLNAVWPSTFFEIRDRRVALAVVAGLDVTVAAEALLLRDRDRLAAALLVPYLLWSLYATALTAAVSDPG